MHISTKDATCTMKKKKRESFIIEILITKTVKKIEICN